MGTLLTAKLFAVIYFFPLLDLFYHANIQNQTQYLCFPLLI